MKVIERGTAVASVRDGAWRSCCFPSICADNRGRWFLGFRGAQTKGGNEQSVFLTWSDDQGSHWREPVAPFSSVEDSGRPGRFRTLSLTPLARGDLLATLCWVDATDPAKPFFNEITEGLLDCKLFTSRSQDQGASWTTPAIVDTGPYLQQPTPSTGPIIELPDGRWACPFELNKNYDDPAPWRHGACMTFSSDQGTSWQDARVVAQDENHAVFFWDQRTSLLPDGSLLALLWTFDTKSSVYRNIHACSSRDQGLHWSKPWDTGVPGQPSRAAVLDDGSLLMAYVDRTSLPRIACRRSFDGGRTWPAETTLFLTSENTQTQNHDKRSMQDAWAEMSQFSLGLPDAFALPGSNVLVTYYEGPATDDTAIHWVLLHVD